MRKFKLKNVSPFFSAQCRLRRVVIVPLARSHHGPGHSGKLVGKRDGRDLRGSPRE